MSNTTNTETVINTNTNTSKRAKAASAKKRGRGRPANSAWKSIPLPNWKHWTDRQIQEKLAAKGFVTSITNIYLKRQRMAKAGKDVICPKSRVLKRSTAEIVDIASPADNIPENE